MRQLQVCREQPEELRRVLLFRARQLELEDRQSRLQQELREKMAVDGKRFNSVIHAQR